MMKKNSKNKPYLMLFFVILLVICDLLFLYFVKYHNQNLNINEFNFKNIGNVINLFFTLLLIFGVVVDFYRENLVLKNNSFLFFLALTQIFLVSAYISTLMPHLFKGKYFLGQNANRLFITSLFTLYCFANFVSIFIVWHLILKIKNLIVLRSMFNSALLMLLMLAMVFFYILKKESGYSNNLSNLKVNNIGVVLGAAVWSNNKPSPTLSARVDKAIELYEKGKLSQIYLTGSNAPGELTESEVALNYVKSLGKNIPNIFLEKESTSTIEQIEFIKKKLLLNSNNRVIVISDGYHLVRVQEIGKFQNIKFKVIPSGLKQSFETSYYNKIREALALTVFWFFAI
jgi:vancomycin permeability regulator SanA